MKLAKLAGPPLTGIPNTMNAKMAKAISSGLAAVTAEAESPRGGTVQGVLDLGSCCGGRDDADRKVMRRRLMESAEGNSGEDRAGRDETRERAVPGWISAALI